jgi:hypothetical protein
MLSNILCSPTTFIRVFLYMKDGHRDLGDSSRHVSQNTGQCPIRFLRMRFVGCSASLDVSFGVVQRLSARRRSLPLSLSLSAHVLVLSLSTVKVKRGDGGGRWKNPNQVQLLRLPSSSTHHISLPVRTSSRMPPPLEPLSSPMMNRFTHGQVSMFKDCLSLFKKSGSVPLLNFAPWRWIQPICLVSPSWQLTSVLPW